MTTLLLVRHGESEANRRDIFAGHLDVDLQNKGLKQAEKTAEYIKENYNISKVYASDLKRAYKTGKCIADFCGVEIIEDKNLREINAGEWDGLTFDELKKMYRTEFEKWCTDIGNAGCNGGETTVELAERILSEITKLAEENDGKTIVIATHATPVRSMQCICEGRALSEMKDIPWASNASVTEIRYDKGVWELVRAGIDEHMAELRTALPENV